MRKVFTFFFVFLFYLKNILYFNNLLSRVFNKSNFNKFLIIFIVGFVSRILVAYFYSVNVYIDYLSPISIFYYVYLSAFIILVHELVDYYGFNIIPSFINVIYKYIINIVVFLIKMLISMNKRIFLYKLEDIKISSIVKGAKFFFNGDKATMDINPSSINDNINKIPGIKSTKANSYMLEKNGDDEPKPSLPRGRNKGSHSRRDIM